MSGPSVCHRRIVIVGCGYVGTAVAKMLIALGNGVIGTTTSPSRCKELRSAGVRPIVADARRIAEHRGRLADCDAMVITLAAGRRGDGYREVYADGAKYIIAALAGTAIRRLIYTSSTRVYQENDGGWVDESSPTAAVDEPCAALIDAENTFLAGGDAAAAHASVLRLGGIHGPGRNLATRIRAAAGTTRSDGQSLVNLVYLRDIVAVVERLLNLDHHGVLNVTDGSPMARRDLFDPFLAREGLPPIRWEPDTCDVRGKRVGNRRACELLGVCFQTATEVLARGDRT